MKNCLGAIFDKMPCTIIVQGLWLTFEAKNFDQKLSTHAIMSY